MTNSPTKSCLTLLLALVLLLSLVGCRTTVYDFDDFRDDDVVSIEFYDLRNSESSYTIDGLEPFFTVPAAEQAAFLSDLRELHFADTVVFLIAMDPSFSFDDYVVRIELSDGSYKLMSSGGYNRDVAADGTITENHFFCADGDWNDLLFAYCGSYAARLCYRGNEYAISADETAVLQTILEQMTPTDTVPDCDFPTDDFIKWDGKCYYLAEGEAPYIRVDESYYIIATEDVELLYAMLPHSCSYWRYNDRTATS